MPAWRKIVGLSWQLALLLLLVAAFFLRAPQVSGNSMEPTIASGEYVLIDTLSYRFGPPARNDIVAFRHDGDARAIFIKRAIALPGDRIRIDRGVVYVNGARLREPYVEDPDARSVPELTVPPKSVYVLGDNRKQSEDSRSFGPVPDSLLIGKALAGVWPAKDFLHHL